MTASFEVVGDTSGTRRSTPSSGLAVVVPRRGASVHRLATLVRSRAIWMPRRLCTLHRESVRWSNTSTTLPSLRSRLVSKGSIAHVRFVQECAAHPRAGRRDQRQMSRPISPGRSIGTPLRALVPARDDNRRLVLIRIVRRRDDRCEPRLPLDGAASARSGRAARRGGTRDDIRGSLESRGLAVCHRHARGRTRLRPSPREGVLPAAAKSPPAR